MYSVWTKHLKDEESKKRFREQVLSCKQIFERLDQILTEMDKDILTQELNTKIYDIPNWDYRQAHTNGMRSNIQLVKKLINLDQKD